MPLADLLLNKISEAGGSNDYTSWKQLSAVDIGEILTMARHERENPVHVEAWKCPDCGARTELTPHEAATVGTPYCPDCEGCIEMEVDNDPPEYNEEVVHRETAGDATLQD